MKKLIILLFFLLPAVIMSQRISELPPASSIGEGNLFVIVQDGVTKKLSYEDFVLALAADSTLIGSDTGLWVRTDNRLYPNYLTDRVGIGTSDPTSSLHIGTDGVSGDSTGIRLGNGRFRIYLDTVPFYGTNYELRVDVQDQNSNPGDSGTISLFRYGYVYPWEHTLLGFGAGYGSAAVYYATAFGYLAASNSTAQCGVAVGAYALMGNGGQASVGIGRYSMIFNTGFSSIGIGEHSSPYNDGTYCIAMGLYSMAENVGDLSMGVGYFSMYDNSGQYSNGYGANSGFQNTGDTCDSFGYGALMYNDGDSNIAIGGHAFNDFPLDISGEKHFDHTDVIPDYVSGQHCDTITIPSHNFGANGTYLNLKYTQGTAFISGMDDGGICQFRILNDSTLIGRSTLINGAGLGHNHTLTPRYVYSNSIAIGYNAEPDSSNQIKLGNANTEALVTAGSITLGSFIQLTPTADPPSPAQEGMLYSDTDQHLYYYNGSTWKQLDN